MTYTSDNPDRVHHSWGSSLDEAKGRLGKMLQALADSFPGQVQAEWPGRASKSWWPWILSYPLEQVQAALRQVTEDSARAPAKSAILSAIRGRMQEARQKERTSGEPCPHCRDHPGLRWVVYVARLRRTDGVDVELAKEYVARCDCPAGKRYPQHRHLVDVETANESAYRLGKRLLGQPVVLAENQPVIPGPGEMRRALNEPPRREWMQDQEDAEYAGSEW
jgi:hypothetical protein